MTEPGRPNADSRDLATRLALDRTRVAFERTMLSWIRTGTSLITFGFSVYKFFQIERKPDAPAYLMNSQQFGLILVGIGVGALTLGTSEYLRNMRGLSPDYKGKPAWMVIGFAGSIAILGILAFVVMLFRI